MIKFNFKNIKLKKKKKSTIKDQIQLLKYKIEQKNKCKRKRLISDKK